jgi:hypothetical protein
MKRIIPETPWKFNTSTAVETNQELQFFNRNPAVLCTPGGCFIVGNGF